MYTARRVAALAARWASLRLHAASLRRARAEIYCQRAEPWGANDTNGADDFPTPTQGKPCWKTYTPDYDGEGIPMPKSDWCVACQEREEINRLYREATRARGAAMRALQAVALRYSALEE